MLAFDQNMVVQNQEANFKWKTLLIKVALAMYLCTLRFSPIENTTVDDIAKPTFCDMELTR